MFHTYDALEISWVKFLIAIISNFVQESDINKICDTMEALHCMEKAPQRAVCFG